MRIACVSNRSQNRPEGRRLDRLSGIHRPERNLRSGRELPRSIIVSAMEHRRRSCGLLFHLGRNHAEYLKAGSDGRTIGTGVLPQVPVYQLPLICVGLVICMDIQNPTLVQHVVAQIKSSGSFLKFLCIPADMRAHWFPGDRVEGNQYEGLRVIMCNSTTTLYSRRESFITDCHRTIVCKQTGRDPIYLELPGNEGTWPHTG